MQKKIKTSWEKIFNPKNLKQNIIIASIYSMAFEILKSCIQDRIITFYTEGFDENGFIVSKEYKDNVLILHRNPIFASLEWLKLQGTINQDDITLFESIKRHRNELTHELLKIASEGCDFDIAESFVYMIKLLKKIELWWFVNFELAIDPVSYPSNFKADDIIFSSLATLQILVQTALGSEEEAMKFYNEFIANIKN